MKTTTRLIFGFAFFVATQSALAGGKLLATGGVTQFEGSAGGGLTPWALIAGYGTRDEVGGTVFYTTLDTSEYGLNAFGLALGIWDRLELSYARQNLAVGSAIISNTFTALTGSAAVRPGTTIRQDVYGAKLRLFGDAILAQDSFLPQVALGVQYKRNLDFDEGLGVPALLGAKDEDGTDIYLSATKAFLGVPAGKILLINLTARATKANAFGLLGFGRRLDPSDPSGATLEQDNGYEIETEGSLGIFLSREVIVGVEYRTQSNRLDRQPTLSSLGAPGLARESSARDFFLAYVPNKNVAVTVAHVDLGNLPFQERSNGFYLSVQASF